MAAPEEGAATPPLDHPTPERPHRLYFALTNHCNRACPWCSTCSSPQGSTWLSLEDFAALLPAQSPFEAQLEGGEPTLHPRFFQFVERARANPRCARVVVCTNGTVLPRAPKKLRAWLARLGAPLVLKLSLNHHLVDCDEGLLALARQVRDTLPGLGPGRQLVVNVRLRRGIPDDEGLREAVEQAGLGPHANIFYLQRYGFASDRADWDAPAPVSMRFTLVNPDGQVFGPDLVARSEAMRRLR